VVRRLLWPAAILVILIASHSFWLPLAARPLIRNDGPEKADIVVVLAGDPNGRRVMRAASLVREGFAPAVLVSGPEYYGIHECDLAIDMAVRNGYPREIFIPFPHSGMSTREEAGLIVPELRRRNVRSFLLVTSDYHTARSGRLFGAAAQGLTMRVVAAEDKFFQADSWWTSREGQKAVFFEWTKTFATAMGK
jgi:uncharacterized SAM-binding protein YcdF (DUF218 family)